MTVYCAGCSPLTALAALFAVAGCGDDEEEPDGGGGEEAAEVEKFAADTTMGKIQEKGEIAIGVKYDVPPFGFKNPQSGEIEGFDIDVGKEIAEELGVEAKFIEAISDNRIPFLKDGTADLIISTMTINKRARSGDRLLRAVLRGARPHAGRPRTRRSPGVEDLKKGTQRLHRARLDLRGER